MPKIELIARGVATRDGPAGPEILLCKSVAGEYSYLPGGHVKFGEGGAKALQREMIEETGLEIEVGPLLLTCEARFIQAARIRHEVNLVFHMKHDWPKVVLSLESKIAFEWVRLDRLGQARFLPRALADRLIGGGLGANAPWLSIDDR